MSPSILSRALLVMDEISKSPQGLRFSEVQRLLGNPSPTTVNKILKELMQHEVLCKNHDGRYVIGMKAYFWGKTVAAKHGPMYLIRQCMAELQERFAASVNLFICSGEFMLCLESISSPQSPSLWPAGKSVPLQLPVIGSLFFFQHDVLTDETFVQSECEQHHANLNAADVLAMIHQALEAGIQIDAGLFYSGVYRMAVPLLEHDRVTMVLGLGILEARVAGTTLVDQIVSAMLEMKQRIERYMSMQN
ncbi:IclR family transcriptional regulator [Desulfovibrio inopinatus]|uniref:IclR family transcriptional regulator n=1 Tax=Desulfovibrio inopinatus TaxID=102109 RepID=UPI000404D592|nr:IclR family transcriptional regulator [Desulfovibrio inopinatus]